MSTQNEHMKVFNKVVSHIKKLNTFVLTVDGVNREEAKVKRGSEFYGDWGNKSVSLIMRYEVARQNWELW